MVLGSIPFVNRLKSIFWNVKSRPVQTSQPKTTAHLRFDTVTTTYQLRAIDDETFFWGMYPY